MGWRRTRLISNLRQRQDVGTKGDPDGARRVVLIRVHAFMEQEQPRRLPKIVFQTLAPFVVADET